MPEEGPPQPITRRTVAKGAVWALPAVPLFATAPAYAASPQCVKITFGGSACKWPGGGNLWSYNVQLCFTNGCGGTYPVWIDRLENNSAKALTPCTAQSFEALGQINVPPGTHCYGPFPYKSSSSASKVVVYGWIGQQTGAATAIAEISTTSLGSCSGSSPCA